MKIRTICIGNNFGHHLDYLKLKDYAKQLHLIERILVDHGYQVQTMRMSVNFSEDYLNGNEHYLLGLISDIEDFCIQNKIQFFNIGYAEHPKAIDLIPLFIKNSTRISASAKLNSGSEILYENIIHSARVIKELSLLTADGSSNFRFAAWSNCPPHIPFFPASYWENEGFSIGMECSDLVNQAFENASDFKDAEFQLRKILTESFKEIEKLACEAAVKTSIKFHGIDASIAPSVNRDESIAYAFEKLIPGQFGDYGSLAVAAMITRVIKSLPIQLCGFSGLMFPVAEDYGLAERAIKSYKLEDLLLLSTVCSCGLDTIPLHGDISQKELELILLDLVSLSIKLNKALAARLFPIQGKKTGDLTEFNSPYLVNCKVF